MRRVRTWALATTVVCSGLLFALIAVAIDNPAGQFYDEHAMLSLYGAHGSARTIFGWLGTITVWTAVAVLVVCAGVAFAQGRSRDAVVAFVIVAGANVTTQVLKQVVITRPDHGWGALNSLPSGHTTVITTLTFAALIVVPPVFHLLASGVGAVAIALITGSMVTAAWHRPSDVFAGLLVSLIWAGLALCIRRPPQSGSSGSSGLAAGLLPPLAGSTVAMVFLAVIGVRPREGWYGLPEAFLVLAAIAIAVTGTLGIFTRLMALTRR